MKLLWLSVNNQYIETQRILWRYLNKIFLHEQLEITQSYPEIQKIYQIRILTILALIGRLLIMNRQNFKFSFIHCDAVFPKPTLKRETIGIQCESEFRIMLAQSLELFYTQKIDIVDEEFEQQLEPQSEEQIILNLINEFYTYIECYLEGLQKYFRVFINVNTINSIDLLVNKQFIGNFIAMPLDLSTMIFPFENIINELHHNQFFKYPQYPKFSIWRMMIKMWINIQTSNESKYDQK